MYFRKTCKEWWVKSNKSRVTCKVSHCKCDPLSFDLQQWHEWHVQMDIPSKTCQEGHAKYDISRVTLSESEWLGKSYTSRIYCQKWHVKSDTYIYSNTHHKHPTRTKHIEAACCLKIYWLLQTQKVILTFRNSKKTQTKRKRSLL